MDTSEFLDFSMHSVRSMRSTNSDFLDFSMHSVKSMRSMDSMNSMHSMRTIRSFRGINNDAAMKNIYHFIIQITVDSSDKKKYIEEVYLVSIYDILAAWPGFLYRSVHHLTQNSCSPNIAVFVIIMAFDDINHLRSWIVSDERKAFVNNALYRGIAVKVLNEYGGIPDDEATNVQLNRVSLQDSLLSPIRPRPPPKWKLFLITLLGVSVATTLINFNRIGKKMTERKIPSGLAIFINLIYMIAFLLYSFFPLIQSIPLVDSWLRLQRPPAHLMSPLLSLLDGGLQMFAISSASVIVMELRTRVDRLEKRISSLRQMNFNLSEDVESFLTTRRDMFVGAATNVDEVGSSAWVGDIEANARTRTRMIRGEKGGHHNVIPHDPARGIARNMGAGMARSMGAGHYGEDRDLGKESPLTLTVVHRVKWESTLAFERWTERMAAEMARADGFMGYTIIQTQTQTDDGDEPYVAFFTFDTILHLLAFVESAPRRRLMKELEPLLEAVSVADLARERVIGDVFSELFVSTGGTVSARPPPMWKTYIMVVIPLFLVVWPVSENVYPILLKEYQLNPVCANFICACINVFTNTYIGVPIMHAQFGDWLRLRPHVSIQEVVNTPAKVNPQSIPTSSYTAVAAESPRGAADATVGGATIVPCTEASFNSEFASPTGATAVENATHVTAIAEWISTVAAVIQQQFSLSWLSLGLSKPWQIIWFAAFFVTMITCGMV